MSTAKKDTLVESLWLLTVRDLIARLEHGEEEMTKEGELVTVKVKPQTLSVIVKFLKDNEMKAPIDNPETDKLARLLAKASEELDGSAYQ